MPTREQHTAQQIPEEPQPSAAETRASQRDQETKRIRSQRRKRRLSVPADQGLTKDSAPFDPSLYINRELSWLEFNHRVLEEARDPRHPLLERVKFLSIVSSNLDEFFMIRIAGIKEQIMAGVTESSPDGRSPLQQLTAIHARVESMVQQMSACFWEDLHPRLAAAGIHLLKIAELSESERLRLHDAFARDIFPVLTPLAFDPGHPFPYISNLSLSLAVVVKGPSGEEKFGRVKVPDVLPRIVPVPGDSGAEQATRFVWLEDLIGENLGMLFPGMSVKEFYAFRVTRNADIEIEEDEAGDLISMIAEGVRQRRFGSVLRVGIQDTMPARIRDILVENLEVTPEDVYRLTPPLGLSHLMALMKLPRPDLKDPPFTPAFVKGDDESEDVFAMIRRGDIVTHHPYDSFSTVVRFIRSAVEDPNVLAIKQTLYRIGKESPLVPLFIKAAESGKQVAVLVELKARFDEENNIGWAKQLEQAGVHVVYGLVGLKTHAKIVLVVRKEQDGLRRYVHLGTGNYNALTARVYTDLGLFTCREDITDDASEFFNFLTGYSRKDVFRKLMIAPVNLRERMRALIERETQHAREGRPSRLIFKMNALTDLHMIGTLYEASKAGVTIDLIVRGVCCLRPGVKGVSETIRVISIVGRFLEHSRVFYFGNGGQPEIYLSSADLMGRNLDRRVELMFPIEDPFLAEGIKHEVLDTALRDNLQARVLTAEGVYRRPAPPDGEERVDSQAFVLQGRAAQQARRGEPKKEQRPVPREAPPQQLQPL